MPFENYKEYRIENKGKYSELCLKQSLDNLGHLLSYIQNLDYGRNSNKDDFFLVFKEQKGTCSSKHAFLYELIKEQNWKNWNLCLALYIIDSDNTPEVEDLLLDSGILEIPNAHVYLKYKGKIVDATKTGSEKLLFKSRLIKEEVIDSVQTSEYKTEFLKENMKEWYKQSELSCSISLQKTLDIREQIIKELSVTSH